MKYKTKPIDFTGCHPVIADHLRRGLSIECRVWEYEKGEIVKKFICGHNQNDAYAYLTDDGLIYPYAEPVEPQLRVKNPVDLMKALVAGGWKVRSNGFWVECTGKSAFVPEMWQHCGRNVEDNDYDWDPEWLEEV